MKKTTFKFGRKVYHVANPDTLGVMTRKISARWIEVVFEKEITFSMNPTRVDRVWMCSKDLLYFSSAEARINHNPGK